MRAFTFLVLSAALVTGLHTIAAQVHVDIGPAPDCPYGYYDGSPYDCAPSGYYGPEWFVNDGLFIGAGPWFHGDRDFHGHVDNHFDRDHGYRGDLPRRGDRRDESKRVDRDHFHGNEMRDGRGHVVNGDRR